MKDLFKKLFARDKFTKVTLPIILIVVLALIAWFSFPKTTTKELSTEEARVRAEEFINKSLMQAGNKATIKEVTSEYDLYKLKIDIVSEVVESYLSKDGKLFFPQALNIDEINNPSQAGVTDGGATAPVTEITNKTDQPVIELFVMSHCPYGTQMEKGLLPVLAALGNKVKFDLKFNTYAMHGEKELREQLNQYCIIKEQSGKLSTYLACFLESGDGAACLDTASVNKASLNACVTKTDKQYKIIENFTNKIGYQGSFPGFDIFKADNEKYNVGGSPTLIINGQEVSGGRDSASLIKTVCSAFNEQPKECEATVPSTTPAPGFGSATTNGAADASCN